MHGAHALRTAELLGLIAENGDDITPVGRAVMQSKSLKKTDLVKADAALMALLKHIDELNQNPDRLFTITQVYLYGSVMRRAAEVGDIDLEIRTDRGPRYARGTNFQLYLDACLACVRSFNPNYYDDGMTREIDKAAEYLIFGKRRSPLLKGAQINSDQLQLIGAPCQLIYSASNGIDLGAPILNAHPDYDPTEETTHNTPQLTTLDTTITAMPVAVRSGVRAGSDQNPYVIAIDLYAMHLVMRRSDVGAGDIPLHGFTLASDLQAVVDRIVERQRVHCHFASLQ